MTPTHIAIVDDEVDIATLLSNYLSAHGFRITALSSGRALTDLMPRDPLGLVLLDLGLPGEDGFAIARQLRELVARVKSVLHRLEPIPLATSTAALDGTRRIRWLAGHVFVVKASAA